MLDDLGVIKANSTGVDPTLYLNGTAIIRPGGQIESLGVNAAVHFAATPAPGTYSVDNFGTIAAAYSGAMWFEQAVTKNEAGALVSSAGSATITFEQGSLDNAHLVTAGASNLADGAIYFEQVAVTNEAGAWIMAQNDGTLAFDGGTLVNAGTVAADGGTLSFNSGVAATNQIGGVFIAEDRGTLILDAGHTISSQDQGLLEATSGGVIDVKDNAIYNGGTQPLAAIDPAGILVNGSGSQLLVDVTVLTLSGGGTLALTGGEIVAMSAGEELINVDNIISGYGTISNLAVTNERTIEATGGTLILSQTTVDNSDHVVGDPVGTVVVAANAATDLENATITGGSVSNAGTIVSEIGTNTISDVASFANDQLTVVSGTTLDLTNDPDINGGAITVERGAVLNLTNVTISGAVVDNEGGTINLFGVDKIDTIQSELTGATVVESGQTLNLLDETIVGGITVDGPTSAPPLSAGVLNIEMSNTIIGNDPIYHGGLLNSGQINVLGINNVIEDDNGAYAFTNAGHIEVEATAALTLASDTVNNTGGTITVDAKGTANSAGALTLTSTTVNDGTIVNNGTLDLVSGNTIDGGALTNAGLFDVNGAGNSISAESLVTNSGTIDVNNGGVLTLSSDGSVDNSATIEVKAGGQLVLNTDTVSNSGTITVDAGATAKLTLTSTTINQSAGLGSITNSGAVTLAGTDTIDNGALDNTASGHIYVSAGSNEIKNEDTAGNVFTNAGHIEVEATAALTLASDTVNNTGGTITVDGGTPAAGQLTLSGTTVNNGTIDNNGLLEATGGSTSTIENVSSFSSSGKISVTGNGTDLTLLNDTLTQTNGTIQVGTVAVPASTLTLAGGDTITGGLLAIGGGTPHALGGGSVFFSNFEIGDLTPGANPQLTLTIGASSGETLVLAPDVHLSIVGSGTNNVTISGALNDINAELKSGLTYTPVSTSSTLALTVNDGAAGDTAFLDLNVANPTSPSTSIASASGLIKNNGLIDVTGQSLLSSDSVLNGSAIVKIEATEVLRLDHTGIYQGTITDDGTVEIAGKSGFNGVTVNISGTGQLIVDGGNVLTLNDTTINGAGSGATINDYSSAGGGDIDVVSASTIAGTASADLALDGNDLGGVTLDAALTLEYVTLNGIGFEDGPLIVEQAVTVGGGVTLTDVAVTNDSSLVIGSGQTLTLADGTSIKDGALTFADDTAVVDVEGPDNPAGGAAATLDGVTVAGGGTIDIGTAAPATPATLLVNSGTTIAGGKMVFGGSTDIFDVEDASGATLDGVTVTGGGVIDVGTTNAAAAGLTIDGGTSITDGALTFGAKTDTLTVDSGSATLDDVAITGGGTIDDNAALTLDGGTSITDGALTIGSLGTLNVEQGGNSAPGPYGATFSGSTVTVSAGGAITAGTTGMLTLDSGASVTVEFTQGSNDVITANGGVIEFANETLGQSSGDAFGAGADIYATGGTLVVEDDATFGTAATVYSTGAGTNVTADGAAFGNNDYVYGTTGGTVEIDGGQFGASNTIDATGDGSLTIEPDSAANSTSSVGNDDTISVDGTNSSLTVKGSDIGGSFSDVYAASGGTLLIEGNSSLSGGNTVYATGGASVTIEDASSVGSGDSVYATDSGSQLTIDGAVLAGGITAYATGGSTLTVEGADTFDANGTFDATGASTLAVNGATFDGDNSVAATGGGSLTLDGGAALASGDAVTLDGGSVTFDGTAIDGTGILSGNLTDVSSVEAAPGTLDITGLTMPAVSAIVDGGATLDVGATSTITTFSSLDNGDAVDIVAGTLDVTGAVTGTGTTQIDGGATLDVTGAISGGGTTQIDAGGTFEIGSNDTDTVTFNGGSGGPGGTLVIDHAAMGDNGPTTGDFTGTVGDGSAGDFTSGDTIDLKDVTFSAATETDIWTQGTGANSGGGTLTIYSGSTAEASLTLAGAYSQNDFELVGTSNNGASGSTEVVWNAAASTVSQGAITFTSGSPPTFENGHWVVDDGIVTLSGVDQVTIGTQTYLLVDHSGATGGYQTIQSAITAATAGETVLVANGTYGENVALKDGVNVEGLSQSGVVVDGTLSTPAQFDKTTVSNLTVNDGSPTAMLLDMTATAEVTSSTFDHVTFNLTADSTLPVLIGNGQVAYSMALGGTGLTFSNDTMNSGDHVAGSTAFAYTLFHSVNGAQLVIDNTKLEGTAGANGLGAQWNMSPNQNGGETAYVTIENSNTSGGGNYYVSGMTGATVTGNTFDGQGLALNGVAEAGVTDNTFENVDGTYTANGTQDRGLTVENAWGTTGDSDISITGNTFAGDTVSDGAIALQRWQDINGNPTAATITTLNDLTIDGNTFTGTTTATPIYLNAGSFGAGTDAILPPLLTTEQVLIGTISGETISDAGDAVATTIVGGSGNDTIIGGDAMDTAYYVSTLTPQSFSYDSADSQWVVDGGAAGGTDHLSAIFTVTDGAGDTFLLVGGGGFTDVATAAATGTASPGDTIIVDSGADGTTQTIVTNDLTVDAVNGSSSLTLSLGTDASNHPVTTLTLADYAPNTGAPVTVTGNNAGDTITGNDGNDTLHGGTGNDTFNIGSGSNIVTGGGGHDTVNFAGTTLHASDFTFNSVTGTWSVENGNATDSLTGIQTVTDGHGHTFLLVDQAGTGAYGTIQSAINAATVGGTLLVAGGTYTEQDIVDPTQGHGANNLTIQGIGAVTVDAPATLELNGVSPTSNDSIDGIFTVNNATGVTIENLTVDGLDNGAAFGNSPAQTSPELVGIAYLNSTGRIDSDTVTGIRESLANIGDQRNVGIYVANDPGATAVPTVGEALNAIAITDSTVTQFQKGGIVVENADATISGNTVTGVGDVDTAQNGIQVSGSTGTVSDNIISNIDYNAAGGLAAATGVLAFYNFGLDITGNSFTGVAGGNLETPVGVYVLDSTNGEITDNSATYVDNGVAGLSDAFGTGNDLLGSWTVTGNTTGTVAGDGGSIYWDADPNVAGSTFTVTGGATDTGDVFFVSPGTDTLTGGGGGGNTFVVVNGTDLSAADTIDGGGASGNVIDFASATAGDTLTVGSNVTDVQEVDVVGPTYAATDTTPLNVNIAAAPSVLTVVANDGGDVITGNNGNDTLHGGTGNDTFNLGTGSNTVTGGGGVDTAEVSGAGYGIAIQNGHWVITNSVTGAVDTLSGIDKVDINGTTYDLVDKLGTTGGFQSVQAAIDSAHSGDKILVAPGTYTESANYDSVTGLDDSTHGANPVGLLVDKSVTIEGVDASGTVITDAANTAATIVSSVESNFGTNFYVTAGNVTITGLNFQASDLEGGQHAGR